MKKSSVWATAAVILAGLLFVNTTQAKRASAKPSPADQSPAERERFLRLQLFLDASDFKPGVIDGRWGEFTRKALARYEVAQGNPAPVFGEQPPTDFDVAFDNAKQLLIAYRLTADDEKNIGPIPKSHAEQAKMPRLPFESALELVASKFHARRDLLRAINPGVDWGNLHPGAEVQVPNVAHPFDVQEAIDFKKQTEQAEKANAIPLEKDKPEAEQLSLHVNVAEKMMDVMRGGKLVGSYPITPGSKSLPAPIGEWFVKGIDWMPIFRWDDAMLMHGERTANAHMLPPGPNNPVGIVWMELNHKGSGLHGTAEPETIGRATSHGCIRLANWDALDLGKKIRPGIHVTIR